MYRSPCLVVLGSLVLLAFGSREWTVRGMNREPEAVKDRGTKGAGNRVNDTETTVGTENHPPSSCTPSTITSPTVVCKVRSVSSSPSSPRFTSRSPPRSLTTLGSLGVTVRSERGKRRAETEGPKE